MDIPMFSLNNLRTMEVIDIKSGCKLGYIKDLKIDCNDNKIISILIPNQKIGWFSKNDDLEIAWSNISKIGVDVILVDGTGLFNIND